jgi:hypothetical protein
MIGRALLGAAVAAVALFILGFIFHASGLQGIATGTLDNAQAAAVQQSLAANLPETGTFQVPSGGTSEQTVMYGQGPISTIHYNTSGFAIGDPGTLVLGFLHMLVVALLMSAGLGAISRFVTSSGERTRLLVLGVLGATLFIHLREPIWLHHDWTHFLYLFVTDTVSLIVAGLIILKLLPHGAAEAAAHAAAPAPPPAAPPTDV